jgi:hypothetical protein
MKKILFAICLLASLSGIAQDKFIPAIKKGSKLTYTVFTDGNSLPFIASVDSLSKEYVKIGWNIEGLGTGGWIMKKKSLESANKGYWNQPNPGVDEDLADDATVMILSKAQWSSLQQNKKMDYNESAFAVKDGGNPIKVGGKTVDTIYLEGGSTRMWVLNNPDFPALLKVEGNTHGIDLEINSIN